MPGPKPKDPIERALKKITVDPQTGCLLWTGGTTVNDYPVMRVGSKSDGTRCMAMVYRLFYERFKGLIPTGYTIDHLCRVHRCVNPEHLEAVTNKETYLVRGTRQCRACHCESARRQRMNRKTQ